MIKNISLVTLFLVLFMYPTKSFATTYDYYVVGQFHVGDVTHFVSGRMGISDYFINNPQYGYQFQITEFSLNIDGNLSFSGNSGWIDYRLGSPDGYETFWTISNSQYSWGSSGSGVFFFTSDMNPYVPIDSEHFGELAPNIILGGLDYASPFGGVGVGQIVGSGNELRLTRNATPVPEPATITLLGVVVILIPIIGYFRRRARSHFESVFQPQLEEKVL
jgi:hypothetical protein